MLLGGVYSWDFIFARYFPPGSFQNKLVLTAVQIICRLNGSLSPLNHCACVSACASWPPVYQKTGDNLFCQHQSSWFAAGGAHNASKKIGKRHLFLWFTTNLVIKGNPTLFIRNQSRSFRRRTKFGSWTFLRFAIVLVTH